VNEVTRHSGYDVGDASELHPGRGGRAVTGDVAIVALALVVVVAVRTREPVVAGVGALGCAILVPAVRRAGPRWAAVALVLVMAAAGRSEAGWTGLQPDALGPFTGWAEIVTDPQPYAASTRVILEIDGERFETWSRGRAQQQRVMRWRGGESVRVSGDRQALEGERATRVAWQHVVGRFDLEWASDVAPGSPLARASNRIRAAIERSSAFIVEPHDALFRGLVIGDDRDQPSDMIERFRASGLSHLTAVSGQNVAFVLAACGPLLVRLRPGPRWLLTVAVIAWFVAITRFEPSILRAGVMAGLSATAFVSGRERSPVRLLALAVIGLAVIDPLLLWSVGFWLSVGATGGVCTIGPWLAHHLSRLGALALPLGVTLGAQVGVVLPSVLVFGRLPLVSVAANLLAVPVAGGVMLYGLPVGLLVGVVPALGPTLMVPAAVGTRWVDTVAQLGARLEPGPPGSLVGWGVIVVVVAGVVVRARFRRARFR
jgi:competence protein ComEC